MRFGQSEPSKETGRQRDRWVGELIARVAASTALSLTALHRCRDERSGGTASSFAQHVSTGTETPDERLKVNRTRQLGKPSSYKQAVNHKANKQPSNKLLITKPTNLVFLDFVVFLFFPLILMLLPFSVIPCVSNEQSSAPPALTYLDNAICFVPEVSVHLQDLFSTSDKRIN